MFTPPLVEGPAGPCGCGCALTPETSLGFAVVDFASEVLLIDLHPWQRWLLIHMMELLPDNRLRFRTVVVLVARQNGKSLVSRVVALWFMYVYGVSLVLGTAQDLDTAEDVWQGAVDLVEELDEDDEPLRPDLYDLLENVVKVNGKKALVINRPPGVRGGKRTRRYKVKAANRRAGRGLSGDLIMLDELREHQSWDAWGAITKTTMARAMALILCLSNAGDATSIVLRYLRKLGHAAAGDPDGLNAEGDHADDLKPEIDPDDEDADEWDDENLVDDLFIAEWSAPPGCSVKDRDGWAQANPSMNYPNGISERTIASAARTDPEHVFRPEVLCQWLDSSRESFFPIGTWEGGRWVGAPGETPGEDWQIVGNVKAGVATSHDRTTTYVAFAGWRPDGLPQVEIVARRAGQDWVAGWLTDPKRCDLIEEVTGQTKGAPVSGLMKDLKDAVGDDGRPLNLPIIDWQGDDLAGWTGAVYDLVRQGSVTDEGEHVGLRHMPHPDLDVAAATAVSKPLGDRFVIDLRNSPADAAPLQAAVGAVALLIRTTAPAARSAYEDRAGGDEKRPVVMTV